MNDEQAHAQFERDRANEKSDIVAPCEYCANLDDMEREYPDDTPHHGAVILCDECGAQYFEEFQRDIWACNSAAKINHPNLKML